MKPLAKMLVCNFENYDLHMRELYVWSWILCCIKIVETKSVYSLTHFKKMNISHATDSSQAFLPCLFRNRDMKIMFCFSRLVLLGILYFEVVMSTIKNIFLRKAMSQPVSLHFIIFFSFKSFPSLPFPTKQGK